MRPALLLALTLCLPAFAGDDLDPEKAAKIARDTDKALKDVDKKYGNKKSSELSSDERKAVIADRKKAEEEVLEKNGTDAKSYTIYTSKMNREDRAATRAAGEKLEAQEKAAEKEKAEKEKAAAAGPKEVQIQKGPFGDNNPMLVDDRPGGAPIVEKGLPKEYQDDQNSAGLGRTDSSSEPAPAKKKKPTNNTQ